MPPPVWWALVCGTSALAGGCSPDPGTGPGTPPILWEVKQAGYGPPALDARAVYFATPAHEVVAIDRATGAVRWRAQSDGAVGGDRLFIQDRTRAADGLVLFGDVAVYAVDANTGQRQWVFGGVLDGVGTAPGARPFVVEGARVYTGSLDGWAFAVDLATGAEVWHTGLAPGLNNRVAVAAVHEGLVYVWVRRDGPLFTGEVHALDATTGAIRWSYALPPDSGRLNAPFDAVLEHEGRSAPVLVVSYDDGRVAALNATDGSVRWIVPRPADQVTRDNYRRLTASHGIAVISSTATPPAVDFIAAYDVASGAEQWRVLSEQGSVIATMTSDSQSAFIVFFNGILGAFDLQTGRRQWLRSAPGVGYGGFQSGPTIADDALYIAGIQGLYAIRRP